MQLQAKTHRVILLLVPVLLAITAIAWQSHKNQQSNKNQNNSDTIPKPGRVHHAGIEELRIGDRELDAEIREIDRAMKDVSDNLKEIDWEDIQADIDRSLKQAQREMEHIHLDGNEIQKEINKALREVDVEEVLKNSHEEMQQALKNIDFNSIQEGIDRSMRSLKDELNSPEFKKNIEEAGRVNMDIVRKSLELAKEEIDRNKINIGAQMSKAREHLEKAKEELAGYQEMLEQMDKEGLIDKHGDYTIEYDKGELYINHQKQADEVRDRFKQYFSKDGIEIRRKNGRFDINID